MRLAGRIAFLITVGALIAAASAADVCGVGSCAAPAACANTLPEAKWYACSTILWAKGLPDGKSPDDPVVEGFFTACNAPAAQRTCAQALDLCPGGPQSTQGVTLPGGFDARLLDAAGAAAAGRATLPVVNTTLALYAGKAGSDAVAAVCTTPLALARKDALPLYKSLLATRAAELGAEYDRRRTPNATSFAETPRCFRTALVDVFWTRALPHPNSSMHFHTVPESPAEIWAAALHGDLLAVTQGIYALSRSHPAEAQRYQRLGRALEICRQSCDVDMMLVIDESGSVTAKGFQLSLDAATSFVSGFTDLSQNGTRVGLATFSSGYRRKWGLSRYSTEAAYLAAIKGVRYGGGGTKTGAAIRRGTADLLRDARPEGELIPRGIIIITDGASSDSVTAPANAARDAGLATFGVGVANYNRVQVEAIAGDPSRVFLAKTFEDLVVLAGAIGGATCLASAKISANSTVTVSKDQVRYLEVPIPICDSRASRVALKFAVWQGNCTVYFSLEHPSPNAGNADGRLDIVTGDERTVILTGRAGATSAYIGIVSYEQTVLRITVEECPATPTVPPTLSDPATFTLAVTESRTVWASLSPTMSVSDPVTATPSALLTLSPSMSQTASVSTSGTTSETVTATRSASDNVSRTHEPTASPPSTATGTLTVSLSTTASATPPSTVTPSHPVTSTATASATVHPPPTLTRPSTPTSTATPTLVVTATATAAATATVPTTATASLPETATASETYHPPLIIPPPPFLSTPLGKLTVALAALLLLCCCIGIWASVAVYRRSRWGHSLEELKGSKWHEQGFTSQFMERPTDLLGAGSLGSRWNSKDPSSVRIGRDDDEDAEAAPARRKLVDTVIPIQEARASAFVPGQRLAPRRAPKGPKTSGGRAAKVRQGDVAADAPRPRDAPSPFPMPGQAITTEFLGRPTDLLGADGGGAWNTRDPASLRMGADPEDPEASPTGPPQSRMDPDFLARPTDVLGATERGPWDCGDPAQIRRTRDGGSDDEAATARPRTVDPLDVDVSVAAILSDPSI